MMLDVILNGKECFVALGFRGNSLTVRKVLVYLQLKQVDSQAEQLVRGLVQFLKEVLLGLLMQQVLVLNLVVRLPRQQDLSTVGQVQLFRTRRLWSRPQL
jgi:uncharacterized membrane protein